jgi:hypothetical protein
VVVHHDYFVSQTDLLVQVREEGKNILSIGGVVDGGIYAISQISDGSNDRHI